MDSENNSSITDYLKLTEINEVYIMQASRSLGFALVTIFVPIYLFNLGYSLFAIGILLAMDFAVRTIVLPFAAK